LFKIIIKSPLNPKILPKTYAYLESLKKAEGDLHFKALTTPFIFKLHDFPKMEDVELELTKNQEMVIAKIIILHS
jgi:flagellar assembly factor FliW